MRCAIPKPSMHNLHISDVNLTPNPNPNLSPNPVPDPNPSRT